MIMERERFKRRFIIAYFAQELYLYLEDDLLKQRLARIREIEALGYRGYGRRYEFTHTVPAILAEYGAKSAEELVPEARVRIAGRLMTLRHVRKVFVTRARIVSSLRRQLEAREFIEVETPMMQPLYGGATARPFVTHHNTLDIDLYLRIAPELYLKRLVVGGMDRVYEINRNFRNEGLSTHHNPEFTMLEFYQAYTDYRGLIDFSEELLRQTAIDATGSPVVEFAGCQIDFSSLARFSMREAIVRQ